MNTAVPLLFVATMAAVPALGAGVPQRANNPSAQEAPSPAQQAKERASRQLDLQATIESLLQRTGDLTEIVPATYNDLHAQKDRIELQLAGEKVREQTIQKKIDELTKQAQDQIDRDVTLAQLQTIAEKKEKDTARIQELVKNGLSPAGENDRALADAAEAMVHIQERKEAIAAAVGGGILPSLTKELISVSLDIAQQEATLQALNERLVRVEKARDLYREWWRVSHEPPPATWPAGG